jgi:type IV pilus assembly protein PilA
MKTVRSNKGFTLVEIMIVVVIIGLLAAMAIPAFQKVRQSSIEKTLTNDAKQIASAANQYFMEFGVSTITVSQSNGVIDSTSPLGSYVHQITKGNLFPSSLAAGATFTGQNLALPNGTLTFSPEGQKL